jgi:hypothetical protein
MSRPGLWDALHKNGKMEGQDLDVPRPAFEAACRRFFPGPQIGTALHALLKPAAAVADAVLGTDLQNCSGCGLRELKLNAR